MPIRDCDCHAMFTRPPQVGEAECPEEKGIVDFCVGGQHDASGFVQ